MFPKYSLIFLPIFHSPKCFYLAGSCFLSSTPLPCQTHPIILIHHHQSLRSIVVHGEFLLFRPRLVAKVNIHSPTNILCMLMSHGCTVDT